MVRLNACRSQGVFLVVEYAMSLQERKSWRGSIIIVVVAMSYQHTLHSLSNLLQDDTHIMHECKERGADLKVFSSYSVQFNSKKYCLPILHKKVVATMKKLFQCGP